MTNKNRCVYFNGLERAIDKFIKIVMDILLFATLTAIIAIVSWSFLTEVAKWMERY